MKTILENKKGNTGELSHSVFMLIGVVALIGAGLLALSQMSTVTYGSGSSSVVNETGGFVNSTGYTLAQASLHRSFAYTPSSAIIINATDGSPLSVGNFTITSAGVVKNATVLNWDTVKITYSYTFSTDEPATNATTSGMTAIGSITNTWLSVLVAVTMAGFVVYILVRSFSGSRK